MGRYFFVEVFRLVVVFFRAEVDVFFFAVVLDFVFVLALRVFQELDTLDTDEMRVAEPKPEEGGQGTTPPPGPSGEAGR